MHFALASKNISLLHYCHHFGAIGYGCWSMGNITDKMVNEYLEYHRKPDEKGESVFIIEKRDFQS